MSALLHYSNLSKKYLYVFLDQHKDYIRVYLILRFGIVSELKTTYKVDIFKTFI
jgi:hypothetical protein